MGLRLVLEREAKLASLLPGAAGRRLEASGVLAGQGGFHVVFDNAPEIGWVGAELAAGAAANRLIVQGRGRRSGFEDIAHDPAAGRFYVLVEAQARGGASPPRSRSTTRTSSTWDGPGWTSRWRGATRGWRA